MTLKQATDQAAAAIQAGDLDALALALAARRAALESGEKPTVEILESGGRALASLKALAQRTAFDNTRLSQIKSYLDFRR
jgi:hypothetical protein